MKLHLIVDRDVHRFIVLVLSGKQVVINSGMTPVFVQPIVTDRKGLKVTQSKRPSVMQLSVPVRLVNFDTEALMTFEYEVIIVDHKNESGLTVGSKEQFRSFEHRELDILIADEDETDVVQSYGRHSYA
jgi:hypothetical protein